MRQRSTATAHTTTISRVIWVSNSSDNFSYKSKAFPLGRAFFVTLNIVMVHNIDIPPKSPFGKGGLRSLRSFIKGYMGK